MASDLYNQMGQGNGLNSLVQEVNRLKSKGGDPEQMIQQMLNNGKVTQAQVNAATQRAQQILKMFTPSAHR